jgi:chlorocatechol 1,2-dioxygenase
MSNRLETVVAAMVDCVRDVLAKYDVTFEEYRTGVRYLLDVAEAKEIPLLFDVFFNTTICDIENRNFAGSASTIEGPYYVENMPTIPKGGMLKAYEHDKGEPLILRGRVTDAKDSPIAGAVVDVWHSTPDGLYGGFHGDIPAECYRGQLITDDAGRYEVRTTLPVPYQIPNKGPTGALLEGMGRHSWRPAHVHYKVRKEGCHELTTQAYFEGGAYVEDDCCEGVHADNIKPELREDGVRVVEYNFSLVACR